MTRPHAGRSIARTGLISQTTQLTMKEPHSWQSHSQGSLSAGNQAVMKREIEIPHRTVALHDGVLHANGCEENFVKAMTHDLRTPLNVIIGLCQLLERDGKAPLTANQRDAVDRMERNARALLGTVNHLLTCVRTGEYK